MYIDQLRYLGDEGYISRHTFISCGSHHLPVTVGVHVELCVLPKVIGRQVGVVRRLVRGHQLTHTRVKVR